jgi:Uma2 family endonuclease
MTAKTAISEQEYLSLRYEGVEPEYRDGEVIERSMPGYRHGDVQAGLAQFFKSRQREQRLFSSSEQRIRLYPGRWVVADVAVYHPDRPTEDYPSEPPLIVIEILSPDDRMGDVIDKLEEYRRFGVPYVWLANPQSRKLYVMESDFRQVRMWETQQPPLRLTPDDVFES